MAARQKSWLLLLLYKFLIYDNLTRKSNSRPNFDMPQIPDFWSKEKIPLDLSSLYKYNWLCKKELGSDTPKCIFHRGGDPPLLEPRNKYAVGNRVKIAVQSGGSIVHKSNPFITKQSKMYKKRFVKQYA